jgi:hypothetical protein
VEIFLFTAIPHASQHSLHPFLPLSFCRPLHAGGVPGMRGDAVLASSINGWPMWSHGGYGIWNEGGFLLRSFPNHRPWTNTNATSYIGQPLRLTPLPSVGISVCPMRGGVGVCRQVAMYAVRKQKFIDASCGGKLLHTLIIQYNMVICIDFLLVTMKVLSIWLYILHLL